MRISGRAIGPGEPVYVIAEIGVNHDGQIARALELIERAAEAGADAVKFQYFETDRLMSRAAKLAAYQRAAGEADPIAMLRRLELSADDLAACAERAQSTGVDALVSVFSVELVERAAAMGWEAFKTASPDVVHKPLLEAVARTGLPMVVSTGASTLEEAACAHGWIRDAGAAGRCAWLQCVSAYPTPLEEATLGGMASLARVVQGPVGYSDHTPHVETARLAVEAGACVLEKHLTYDTGATGPDHAASLAPEGFAQYVRVARGATPVERVAVEEKRVLERERDVRRVSRQSIVLRRRVEAGEVIRASDVTFKRPGTGLEPWRVGEVVERRAARAIESDVPVVDEDVL